MIEIKELFNYSKVDTTIKYLLVSETEYIKLSMIPKIGCKLYNIAYKTNGDSFICKNDGIATFQQRDVRHMSLWWY